MPGFYSKHLGPTLAAKLDELAGKPHHEQLQLYEEIGIARLAALQALALSKPVLENDPRCSDVLRASTYVILREAMDHVARLVEAASRIERNAEDKISINILNLFVIQITRAVYRVLGTEHIDLARQIEAEIQASVRLPKTDRKVFDATTILSRSTDELTSQMDTFTIPSEAAFALDEQPSVQDGDCGPAQRQNGVGETQVDQVSDSQETVA